MKKISCKVYTSIKQCLRNSTMDMRAISRMSGVGYSTVRLIARSKNWADFKSLRHEETIARSWRKSGYNERRFGDADIEAILAKKLKQLQGNSKPTERFSLTAEPARQPSAGLRIVAGLVVLGLLALVIMANWIWYK